MKILHGIKFYGYMVGDTTIKLKFIKEAQYSSVWLQQLALTNYCHYVTSAWHAKFNYMIRYTYL